jgi:hypothetical protein
MTDAPRWIAWLHALFAWAGAVGLASAWLARRSAPRVRVEVAAAVAIVAAAASGFVLEPRFLHGARQRLFVRSAHLGWLFERKQHLSAGALFASLALVALLAAAKRPGPLADATLARRALAAAAALSLAAALVGTLVALRAG